MKIRPYTKKDWNSVKDIYNISKPDECRGSVDLRAIIALEKDLKGEIRLNVVKNNTPGRKLYKKFGFVIEKEFVGNFNGYKSQAITLVLNK